MLYTSTGFYPDEDLKTLGLLSLVIYALIAGPVRASNATRDIALILILFGLLYLLLLVAWRLVARPLVARTTETGRLLVQILVFAALFRLVMLFAGLPWGDVRKMEDVLESPTLKARPPFAQVNDGAGGTRRVVEAPYEFSNASSGVRGPAPRRGEHNAGVLGDWLEMRREGIDGLEACGTLLAEEAR